MGRISAVTINNGIRPRNFWRSSCNIEPSGAVRGFDGVVMGCGSQIIRVPSGSTIRDITLLGGASGNKDSKWPALRGGVLKFGTAEKISKSPGLMDFVNRERDRFYYSDFSGTLTVWGKMKKTDREKLLKAVSGDNDQVIINQIFEESRLANDRKKPVIIEGKNFVIPSGYTLMDQGNFLITKEYRNKGWEIPHEIIKGISRGEWLYLVPASYCHPGDLFLPQGLFARAFFVMDVNEIFDLVKTNQYFLRIRETSIRRPPGICGSFNILPEYFGKKRLPFPLGGIVVDLKEGGFMLLQEEL